MESQSCRRRTEVPARGARRVSAIMLATLLAALDQTIGRRCRRSLN
jgi:hypothetical protein